MMEIDKSKLTYSGSMNYILQVWSEDGEITSYHNYMPRRNRISVVDEIDDQEAVREMIAESIERLKIGASLMQDFLDGKTDTVYYYDLPKEDTP